MARFGPWAANLVVVALVGVAPTMYWEPQAIKSEDTRLVGYVTFDMKPGHAEVDVVEACRRHLEAKEASGAFRRPAGVSYRFAGSYETQVRSERRRMVILPVALFGIATDDGVVMGTYLEQQFRDGRPGTVAAIRTATVEAGRRRVRPCLMTTATTILALVPVLTSTGRGADVMVPMAIPSVGGMTIAVLTMLVVPVLYCTIKEFQHHTGLKGWAVAVFVLATVFTGFLVMAAYCTVRDLAAAARHRGPRSA